MDRRFFLTLSSVVAALGAMARPAVAASAQTCATGPWVTVADVAGMPPVRYETAHAAFRWRGMDAARADVEEAGRSLESIWDFFMRVVGFIEPFCSQTVKHRVNVHIDPSFGLSAGLTGEGEMGVWIGPGALRDRFGLAHELTHALQGASGGLRDSPFTDAFHETHANYMATQLPEYRDDLHGSEVIVNFPHVHYGSSRDNYLCFPFLDHLKTTYGYEAINDLWTRSPRPDARGRAATDPWSVLAANQGWSAAQLNDVFARWALRNVTFDHTDLDGTDRGPLMRATYGSYDDREGERRLRITELDRLDDKGTYGVPFSWAPQRWGYNLVRLLPQPGTRTVTVAFAGAVQAAPAVTSFPGWGREPDAVPAPKSGWRWSVVVTSADGRPRYSPLQRGTSGRLQVTLRPDDLAVHLVVVATPTTITKVRAEQVHYSLYRYPWRVSLTGAVPDDGQTAFLAAHPGARRHANGGGWVAPEATVAATAYVGRDARVVGGEVLGRARVLERATILSGTVRDDAVVRGISLIRGRAVVRDRAVVDTTFRGVGAYGEDVVLAGTAQALGDLELWTTTALTRGAHYGFVDDDVAATSAASRAAGPAPEVTARPRWALITT